MGNNINLSDSVLTTRKIDLNKQWLTTSLELIDRPKGWLGRIVFYWKHGSDQLDIVKVCDVIAAQKLDNLNDEQLKCLEANLKLIQNKFKNHNKKYDIHVRLLPIQAKIKNIFWEKCKQENRQVYENAKKKVKVVVLPLRQEIEDIQQNAFEITTRVSDFFQAWRDKEPDAPPEKLQDASESSVSERAGALIDETTAVLSGMSALLPDNWNLAAWQPQRLLSNSSWNITLTAISTPLSSIAEDFSPKLVVVEKDKESVQEVSENQQMLEDIRLCFPGQDLVILSSFFPEEDPQAVCQKFEKDQIQLSVENKEKVQASIVRAKTRLSNKSWNQQILEDISREFPGREDTVLAILFPDHKDWVLLRQKLEREGIQFTVEQKKSLSAAIQLSKTHENTSAEKKIWGTIVESPPNLMAVRAILALPLPVTEKVMPHPMLVGEENQAFSWNDYLPKTPDMSLSLPFVDLPQVPSVELPDFSSISLPPVNVPSTPDMTVLWNTLERTEGSRPLKTEAPDWWAPRLTRKASKVKTRRAEITSPPSDPIEKIKAPVGEIKNTTMVSEHWEAEPVELKQKNDPRLNLHWGDEQPLEVQGELEVEEALPEGWDQEIEEETIETSNLESPLICDWEALPKEQASGMIDTAVNYLFSGIAEKEVLPIVEDTTVEQTVQVTSSKETTEFVEPTKGILSGWLS